MSYSTSLWSVAHRSDNSPEFMAKTVRRWLERSDVKTLFIAQGSPWENGYVESAGGKLRDELLNRELFLSLDEARWVIDRWRLDYNHHRPHSSLNYQTPTEFAARWLTSAPQVTSATPQQPASLRQASGSLNLDSLIVPGSGIWGSPGQMILNTA